MKGCASLHRKLICTLMLAAFACLLTGLALAETTGVWGSSTYTLSGGELTIGAGTGADTNGISPFEDIRSAVTSVVFESNTVLPEDASRLFAGFTNLVSVNAVGLDVSGALDLSGMFEGCLKLTDCNLSAGNASGGASLSGRTFAENANLSGMFGNCASLTSLNLSGTSFSANTDLSVMFVDCASVTSANLTGASFAEGSDLTSLFAGCVALVDVNTDDIGFSGVAHADCMFMNCAALPVLDMTEWDTSGLLSGNDMFAGCVRLGEIQVGAGVDFNGAGNHVVFTLGNNHVYLHDDWWSANADCRYSSAQIAEERSGIADTYTKKAPWTTTNGLWGSCEWKMTVENEVFVSAGTGVGMTNFQSPWAHYGSTLTGVYLEDGVVMPESCRSLFQGLSALTAVEFGNIDATNVKTMEEMFAWGTDSLREIDLRAFAGCAPTDLNSVFWGCSSLRKINMTGIDWSYITEAQNTFYGCSSLTELILGDVQFAPTGYCQCMFQGCNSLETLDLSGFDFRNASNFTDFFDGCDSLQTVVLGEDFTFNNNQGVAQTSLPSGRWLSSADGQIYYSGEIAAERCLTADTYTFQGDDGGAAGRWGTCRWVLDADGLLTVEAGTGAESNGSGPWQVYADKIKSVRVEDGVVMPVNCSYLFSGLSKLVSVEFGSIDATNVKYMEYMFEEGAVSLKEVDLSAFAGCAPTALNCVFYGCSSLEKINLTGLDWSHIAEAQNTFTGCSSLTELILGDIYFAPTGNCQRMFKDCGSLETLDLSGFDFRNASAFTEFFDGCTSLTTVILGENFTFNNKQGVAQTSLPSGKWLSSADGQIYYSGEIAADRCLMADTYTFKGDDGGAVGRWGTCRWVLNGDGLLTVKAGTGAESNGYSPWKAYEGKIKSVRVEDGVVLPVDCSYLFSGLYQLVSVEFGSIDATNVKYMECLFGWGTDRLKEIDLRAFAGCAPTDLNGVFWGCSSLERIDLTGLDWSQVEQAQNTFYGCSSLTELVLGDVQFAPTGNCQRMFYGCSSLEILDLRGFDLRNVTSLSEFTSGCSSLRKVYLGANFRFRSVNDDDIMVNLPVADWYSWAADDYFTTDQISSWRDGINDVYTRDAEGDWGSCHWTLIGRKLAVNAGVGADTAGLCPWAKFDDEILEVELKGAVSLPEDASCLFKGLCNLTSLSLDGIVTSNTSNFSYMFAGESSLPALDVTGFDTSGGADFSYMFSGMSSLPTLNVTGFDTSNGADFSHMFSGMSSLTSLDVTGFDTSGGADFSHMFSGLSGLPSLNVTGFETSAATVFNHMFSGMSGLTELDVTGFDTSRGKDFSGMFSGMSGLTELDLSGFNTGNAIEGAGMFDGMTELRQIAVGASFCFGNGIQFPENVVDGHADWFSGATLSWMSSEGIADSRSCLPDTYGKQAKGTWGTAPWTLDDGGLLTVSAGVGAPTGNASPWSTLKSDITAVVFGDNVVFPADCSALLKDFSALGSVSFAQVDTTVLTNLMNAFSGCTALQTLEFTGLDLSSVANLTSAFSGDAMLRSVDFTGCELSSLELMINAFQNCASLEALDLSGVNANALTRMNTAFSGCSGLHTLDLSGLGTSHVTAMTNLFNGCSALRLVTLGAGFSFKGSVDSALTALPEGSWLSSVDDQVYTSAQIAADRNGVADTYARVIDLSVATVTLTPDAFTYDGESHVPAVQVSLDGAILTADVDYVLTFPEDTTNAGEVTATVAGINTYSGEATAQYAISPAGIEGGSVILDDATPVYTGSAIEPTLTVIVGSAVLDEDDYDVLYADNTNAGTANVTVTGTGNYDGTLTQTFAIQPASIANLRFAVSPQKLFATGSALEPRVTAPDGVTFTVEYSNNVSVGSGAATVKGTGNYTGSASLSFDILSRDSASALMLPASLKRIYESAFEGTAAQLIVIPSGCTAIDSLAFDGCGQLIEIVIPASVTSIAPDAFGSRTDFTIRTTSGSKAASFAGEKGIRVIAE